LVTNQIGDPPLDIMDKLTAKAMIAIVLLLMPTMALAGRTFPACVTNAKSQPGGS
jgi:hypothetical protein